MLMRSASSHAILDDSEADYDLRDRRAAGAKPAETRDPRMLLAVLRWRAPLIAGVIAATVIGAGAITFVGFDYSSSFIEPLKKGELKGFTVQNPVNMGYLSVKTMVEHLQGKQVPKDVDTGVEMVTLENMETPAIQAIINPPEAK